MSKRVISIILIISMVFTLIPAQVFATNAKTDQKHPFADVESGAWYEDAVEYVYNNGLFSGTTNTTFNPDGTMTRAMFVTVLGRMAGVKTADYSGKPGFTDVTQNAYYAPYVQWAVKYGITSGTGNEKFSPDDLVTREQLAAFFVRYFEAFDIDYTTGEKITGQPADLESIAPYARDAVLKLWKQGLLNGDGKKFDPESSATRAQTATLCKRTDGAVKVWYSAPGVVGRKTTSESTTTTDNDSTGSKKNHKTYYEVKFEMGDDQTSITFPSASKTVTKGTDISSLPTPSTNGVVFLGWYYDKELTKAVENGDTVNNNMTLYAKTAAGSEVQSIETPNYVTKADVEAGNFSFEISGVTLSDENKKEILKFINVTGANSAVEYTISDSKITANLEAGQTYKVELLNDSAKFKLDGTVQESSVRNLNIITKKQEVASAQLNEDVIQIDVSETTGLNNSVFKGLYQTDESGTTNKNDSTGTFTYSGGKNLKVGDVLAVKDGAVNLNDAKSNSGDVAYIKITATKGSNKYNYEMADVEDVLFMPDVLPIESSWYKDGDTNDASITISATNLSTALKNVNADSMDKGDFIAFINDTYSDNPNVTSYGEITSYRQSGNYYVITYNPYTVAEGEKAIESSLDVYYTQDRKIELTEEEQKAIEKEIKQDVEDSGYAEQAAAYLAAFMLESDDLEKVPDINAVALTMDDVISDSISIYGANNSNILTANSGNKKVTVEFDPTGINVKLGLNSKLDHLQGNGFDVSINIPFSVKIGDKVSIEVTATFEEEIILKQNISTQRIRQGFLKYDYALNTSFEVGNYTGIGFTAELSVEGDDDEDGSMTEKLDAIMDRMESYVESGGVQGTGGEMDSLAEIYQDVMDNANDSWFDIVEVSLFDTSGSVFFHIFCWQVKGTFVVSANLAVSMGMSFEYTTQKQYNFSVQVKSRQTTNETVDIITPRYDFDFYVVGTLGIRAGIRLEMYVGLFSLKLDKIGIVAEAGAYARLWGYFFYHLSWVQGESKKSSSAGALLMEIGMYLDIKFVAQLLSSEKLTWAPTIYSNEWPLWSAGEQQNIYAFSTTDDTEYTLQTLKSLILPSSTFSMSYMDLKSGSLGVINKDDDSESSFDITLSNPKFSYDAAKNKISVEPGSSVEEEVDMTITMKKASLAFSSAPIQKVIHLSWSDPLNARSVNLESGGGSFIGQISGSAGSEITLPTPTKAGYTFEGWYTDEGLTKKYTKTTITLPTDENQKVTQLYAKWKAAQSWYTVEHYIEKKDGSYELYDRYGATHQGFSAFTGSKTTASAYTDLLGYTAEPFEQQIVKGDESTVIKIYYKRRNVTITWDRADEGEPIKVTYKYGDELDVFPNPVREGYKFDGWNSLSSLEKDGKYYVPSLNRTITAQWTGLDNTVTFDYNYEGSTNTAVTVKTGEKIAQRSNPTRENYVFGGWYTDKNCTNKWNFTTDTVPCAMTLYAKWISNQAQYTVKHYQQNLNDNEYTEVVADRETVTGTKDQSTTATAKSYTGFTAQMIEQKTVAEDSSTVVNVYYNRNTYTVTWKNGDNTLKTDNNVKYGTKLSYTGGPQPTKEETGKTYTFSGWNTKADGNGTKLTDNTTVTGDVTYYAQFSDTVINYNIKYELNGGTNPSDAPATYTYASGVILPRPTYTGCTFEGWYIDSAYTGEPVNAIAANSMTGDKTYYAKWTTNYTVKHYQQNLNDDGYTLVDGDTQTKNGVVGDKTAAEAKTYDGFSLKGSVTQKTIAGGGSTEIKIYYDRNKYSVKWVAHSVSDSSYVTLKEDTLKYGAMPTYSGSTPTMTKAGYTCKFTGWKTGRDGTGTGISAVTGNVTYYAQFTETANTYTITYNWNGGTEILDAPKTYTYSGNKVTLPTPTKAGCVFGGWYYTDSTGVTRVITEIAVYSQQDYSLTATWSEANYTVTFDANGGKIGDSTRTTWTNVAPGIAYGDNLPTPTREAYDFVGWFTEKEGGTQVTKDSNVTARITLYAHWEWNKETSSTTEYKGITGNTPLWIGGTRINGSGNIPGVASVSYDSATGYTITLHGYSYTGDGYNLTDGSNSSLSMRGGIVYNGSLVTTGMPKGNLTIVLEGENTLSLNGKAIDGWKSAGILLYQPTTVTSNLTIKGEGTLDISVSGTANSKNYVIYSYGIYTYGGGTLTIDGCTVNASPSMAGPSDQSNSHAIGVSTGDITINNGGTLTATGIPKDNYGYGYGLKFNGDAITINKGTLIMRGYNQAMSCNSSMQESYISTPESGTVSKLADKDSVDGISLEEYDVNHSSDYKYIKFENQGTNE